MKKILMTLFLGLVLVNCSKDDDPAPAAEKPMKIINKATGEAINNGDVITFNSATDPANKLSFYVKNTTSSPIKVRSKCTSMTNTDGTSMQYCFGAICYGTVEANQEYPTDRNELVTVPANGSIGSTEGFKMQNTATNGTNVIDYVFEFYQHDDEINPIGDKITFTYRYNPN